MNIRVDQAADRLISAFLKDELRHRCPLHCAYATIGKGYMRSNCLTETGYNEAELKTIENRFEVCGEQGWGYNTTKKKVKSTNVFINTKEVASFDALCEVFNAIEELNPDYFTDIRSILDPAVFELVDYE